MKRIILRVVKLACLALALVLTIGVLQEFILCHADHNRQRVKGFYLEEKDSLDLVLMGASEVYSDFAPGYAYAKSGVRSYLYSTQSNTILNYKSQLKNILSRQKPDVILIELNGALYNDDTEVTKEANFRNYADNVPIPDKWEWMWQNNVPNKGEYMFPIVKYHSVWTDFPENMKYQKTVWNDRQRGYNYLKGVLNETKIFQQTQHPMNDTLKDSANSKAPLTPLQEQGLRDLLSFCKSENLTNVVFARFPHIVVKRTYSRFERGNTVGDIVREYGFDYLNYELNFEDTGLDLNRDFYNLDHLNVYGQQKFTGLLTEKLTKDYRLTAKEPSGSQKQEWQTCADYYDAYYRYSDELIQKGEGKELSEDCDLVQTLKSYTK